MQLNNLLYKRGYLISNTKTESGNFEIDFDDWNKDKFHKLNVYHDKLLEFKKSKSGDIEIGVLGIIVDPFNNIFETEIIIENCILFLSKSDDEFWDYVNKLSGRFIILVKTSAKLFAFQDAAGNRSLYYYKKERINNEILLSSHTELIAEIKKSKVWSKAKSFMESSGFKNNNNRYLPGLVTPYENIYSLTPNTLIELNSKRIERFFPRHNLQKNSLSSSLAEELAHLLSAQIKLLTSKFKLAVSLTAGLDSRVSLAATREEKNSILYYTYVCGYDGLDFSDNTAPDAKLAKKLSEQLDFNHKIFTHDGKVNEEFIQVFLRNTSYVSTVFRAHIAEILKKNYPENRLHIKSNVSEIGKAHYRNKYAFLPEKSDPYVFSKLYGDYSNNRLFLTEVFRHFIYTTQLQKENLFNYDLYDLLYWEQYIGRWQSLCLQEWDLVQDSYMLFNNRYILNKMISLPFKNKSKKEMYHLILNELWPDLTKIDINPHKEKNSSKKLIRIIRGISLRMKTHTQ